ncbi:anti-sigma factor family protein [Nocardia arthritidis]|uniref:Zf-HC2 domain-containing protein n=1 Tax=Nocardia arthritidis TaxID=228602 RepID=A0A6G9YTM3_9NOCA|nr:zf-HC2 domain-containing protein [Nocardia arthritidis]QIS16685.1 zf-HC2 domain-containing protein [Nocardia arthritidis]
MTDIATGRDAGDRYLTWDAPYVLGSLTRSERKEYEEHLAGCPDCRAGVAELAALPGMLSLVETDTALAMIEPAERAEPPVPELLPRLTAAAERSRKRGRWVTIGSAIAAAAAAVTISVPVATTLAGSHGSGSEQVFAERSMQPVEPNPVTASVKIIPYEGKTRVVMTCEYGRSDQQYSWNLALFVVTSDGQTETLGQWPAGPGTELTIDRVVDAQPDHIRTVYIKQLGTDKTLLSATI